MPVEVQISGLALFILLSHSAIHSTLFLSKTWHYGKCILWGLCWKGNPGISHMGPFSAVTGGTFWLQVNERIPKDLPHFVVLWCFFPECHIWSLFKQCPTFTHLALISATTGVMVPVVWNVVCCVIITDPEIQFSVSTEFSLLSAVFEN